jgi:cytochrome P450
LFFSKIAPGLVVKKGMWIELPITASHYDEDFFPNPTSFEPERFLKENANNIVPFTFRPFGGRYTSTVCIFRACVSHFFSTGGPRVCIAQRFAINEIKITIAKLINQFKVVETENTKMNIPKGCIFLLDFVNLRVKFEKRDV